MDQQVTRYLSERDLDVMAAAGFGAYEGPGRRPLVLVVDVTYGFTGPSPQPILESIQDWPLSCGEDAWKAVRAISEMLAAARRSNIAIGYSRGPMSHELAESSSRRRWKNSRMEADTTDASRNRRWTFVAEIAPTSEDLVVVKDQPSAFYGTKLGANLAAASIDTLILCGATTSGCVRATAVDAFSRGFRVIIPRECVFDRWEASHAISLFDMDAKYADVLPLTEVLAICENLGDKGSA